MNQKKEKKKLERNCLRCNKKFKTDSPYLRLCKKCRYMVTLQGDALPPYRVSL